MTERQPIEKRQLGSIPVFSEAKWRRIGQRVEIGTIELNREERLTRGLDSFQVVLSSQIKTIKHNL